MIYSLLFIGASDLPVFARTVLYPLCNLEVVGDGYGVTRGGCAKKGMELKSPMKNKLKFRMKVYKLNEHCLESWKLAIAEVFSMLRVELYISF